MLQDVTRCYKMLQDIPKNLIMEILIMMEQGVK